jgi:hypothetical protein
MKGRANRQKTVAEQMRPPATRRGAEREAWRRERPTRDKPAWERRKKR